MKYFQEVTVWRTPTPNHIYYLSDDKRKMVGYIRDGTTELHKFSKPMGFDSRGRKFVVLRRPAESDSIYFSQTERTSTPAKADVIQVAGSGGKTYFLSSHPGGWSCTCPGYMFRRKCRHVEEVSSKEISC